VYGVGRGERDVEGEALQLLGEADASSTVLSDDWDNDSVDDRRPSMAMASPPLAFGKSWSRGGGGGGERAQVWRRISPQATCPPLSSMGSMRRHRWNPFPEWNSWDLAGRRGRGRGRGRGRWRDRDGMRRGLHSSGCPCSLSLSRERDPHEGITREGTAGGGRAEGLAPTAAPAIPGETQGTLSPDRRQGQKARVASHEG